ncbi:MAG: endonuclease/exonuclease/phosphatase family protein [Planctomycetes bacterium]|nr:endonuclease/exonuclease/phosphatase family protein [Planctomycetota bacterium]
MNTKQAICALAVGLVVIGGIGCQSISHTPRVESARSSSLLWPAGRLAAVPIVTSALATTSSVRLAAFAGSSVPAPAPKHISAQGAGYLSVLSFNMQHRDKPAQLAIMAEHLESDLAQVPDFILCQEVLFGRSKRKGPDNTAAVLADSLGYYCRGTKRTSDREGVAIISRYPFDYYAHKHLSARTASFLLGFRRVSVMGEFFLPAIGRVRVVNVHFAHWPVEHHIRHRQLQETLDWIAARERDVPADITILGGDFNIKPHWDEMSLITGPNASQELYFDDFNTSAPTRGPHGRPNARIDYIFVAAAPHRDVRMLAEELLWLDGIRTGPRRSRLWLSDHVPLLHEYAIGPASSATFAQSPERLPVNAFGLSR